MIHHDKTQLFFTYCMAVSRLPVDVLLDQGYAQAQSGNIGQCSKMSGTLN